MRIYIEKITNVDLMRRACKFTTHGQTDSMMTLDKIYRCEHSPMRTQIFWIEMRGIPSFVSTHFVRHSVGIIGHWVQTMRDDRGAQTVADRNTPVNHAMLLNAQAIINMARKRLCMKAHPKTRLVFEHIKDHMKIVDPDLARYMVPECEYRGGVCHELRPCGKMAL
jgi:hypothetical protein